MTTLSAADRTQDDTPTAPERTASGPSPWVGRLLAAALGGLAGGVLGNLTDRLFRPPAFGRGHVVDMISVPHFAIFNVADSFIVCSVIGVALLVMTGRRLDGTREA